ncbi:MAG: hypothetical protein MUO26_00430 [Methanotrichaceae archaeon]|nr:hypothetical protein [Methanotrichaceae archaeon]
MILDINCIVIRDNVTLNGNLVEETLDWYTQDENGSIRYFGDDAKEYENGKVVSTEGSWEAGVDGTKPRIVMEANPKIGDTYRQEYYKGEAEDMAQVIGLNETTSVHYGCSFNYSLMTKEWKPLEPEIIEHKYYAPGRGMVLEVMVEGGLERLELVNIETEKDSI